MFMNMQAQGQGICGGGAFWEISDDRQTLTISGEGAVYAMGQDGVSQPWTADRNTIKTVIVEEGITALQWYSIGNLPNVDSISLPGSLYHVMNHALAKNTKLKKLILPGGIGFFGDNAFGFCDNLEEIVNLSTNPQSMEGTDVNFDKITLSVPPESKEKYKHDVWWGNFGKIKGIGEKDEDIEQEEKKNDEGQLGTEIYWKVQDSILRIWGTGVIPRIADVIIQPWHKLKAEIKYIVIGEGITEIGHFVFKSMLMEYIYLPETLVEIGDEIFKDCVNLKTITIPEKVMFMGWFTFDGCTGLRELIVMNKRPPYAYSDPFDDIYGIATLYVPAEGIENYKSDYDWKMFKNIKTIEEIERKEKSKNGNLERLKLNFEITPEFDPNTTDYYATVGWDVDRSNIIATPQDSFAKIKGTEQTLNTGDNLITIRVQPEDIYECPKEYNFHVYRKNGEARVKSLTINQGTLEPGFTRNTKEYIMRTTKENPFIIIEPTPVDEKAKVNVIKEIFSQDTTFVIRCTAEDEKFIEQYKIKLEVYNDNAYLKSLKAEGFTLEPEL